MGVWFFSLAGALLKRLTPAFFTASSSLAELALANLRRTLSYGFLGWLTRKLAVWPARKEIISNLSLRSQILQEMWQVWEGVWKLAKSGRIRNRWQVTEGAIELRVDSHAPIRPSHQSDLSFYSPFDHLSNVPSVSELCRKFLFWFWRRRQTRKLSTRESENGWRWPRGEPEVRWIKQQLAENTKLLSESELAGRAHGRLCFRLLQRLLPSFERPFWGPRKDLSCIFVHFGEEDIRKIENIMNLRESC